MQQQISSLLKDKIKQLSHCLKKLAILTTPQSSEKLAKVTALQNQNISQSNHLYKQLIPDIPTQQNLAKLNILEAGLNPSDNAPTLRGNREHTESERWETITVFGKQVTNLINKVGYPALWDE